MGWVFLFYIYYLIIYEKYLVLLYILQVLSHHNYYWLCRCSSKLLAQCADKTYANCKKKVCSSSTFYLPWDSNFQLIIILHNWLCRFLKLLTQCADQTYANCEIFYSSSTPLSPIGFKVLSHHHHHIKLLTLQVCKLLAQRWLNIQIMKFFAALAHYLHSQRNCQPRLWNYVGSARVHSLARSLPNTSHSNVVKWVDRTVASCVFAFFSTHPPIVCCKNLWYLW